MRLNMHIWPNVVYGSINLKKSCSLVLPKGTRMQKIEVEMQKKIAPAYWICFSSNQRFSQMEISMKQQFQLAHWYYFILVLNGAGMQKKLYEFTIQYYICHATRNQMSGGLRSQRQGIKLTRLRRELQVCRNSWTRMILLGDSDLVMLHFHHHCHHHHHQ